MIKLVDVFADCFRCFDKRHVLSFPNDDILVKIACVDIFEDDEEEITIRVKSSQLEVVSYICDL